MTGCLLVGGEDGETGTLIVMIGLTEREEAALLLSYQEKKPAVDDEAATYVRVVCTS